MSVFGEASYTSIISQILRTKKALGWQLPTFAGKPTIIGLEAFHFRVRYGNGWDNPSIAATKAPFAPLRGEIQNSNI